MSYTNTVYTNLRGGIKMGFTYTVTPNTTGRYAKVDWYLSPVPFSDPVGDWDNRTYHMLEDSSTFKITYVWKGETKQYSHTQNPSIYTDGKTVYYAFCDASSSLDIYRNGVTWFDENGNWTGQRWWVHMLGSKWLSGSFNVDYKNNGTASFTLGGQFTCNSMGTQTKWMTFSPSTISLTPIDTICIITYNANGGSGTMANTTYTYSTSGTTTLRSNTFKRTGYTFLGWSLDKSATTAKYSDGQKWNLNNKGDYTLYAIWGIDTYSITYNGNSPTNTSPSNIPSKQSKKYNTSVSLSTKIPTLTGYTFSEWNTKVNGSGAVYKPGDTYKANVSINLYAQWSSLKYRITFRQYFSNDNYGICDVQYNQRLSDANKTKIQGFVDKFTDENPGFELLGWSTTKLSIFETDLTDAQLKKLFDLDSVYKTTGDITLYPVIKCCSTIYVYSDNKWKLAVPYVYSNDKWKQVVGYVYSDNKWKL